MKFSVLIVTAVWSVFGLPVFGGDLFELDATLVVRQAVYSRLFQEVSAESVSIAPSFTAARDYLKTYHDVSTRAEGDFAVLEFAPLENLEGAGRYELFYDPELRTYTKLNVSLTPASNIHLVWTIEAIKDRHFITISIGDITVYKRVPTSISVKRAFLLPFSMVIEQTKSVIRWEELLIAHADEAYERLVAMSHRIRKTLPYLPDAEDGALDEEGNLVFIETSEAMEALPGFNCSGFCKWVVDGLVYPISKRYLSIEPLKKATVVGTSLSAPFQESRDPYFGLDWTRNLSKELYARLEQVPLSNSVDVTNIPGLVYRPNIGYSIQDLEKILYYLAQREPGHFYLGSVNKQFGTLPVLRQHTHVVVLFPYFDHEGQFHINVFERNVETSVSSLKKRYGAEFIHLVRVIASDTFQPRIFE